jgi:hypothetical protein
MGRFQNQIGKRILSVGAPNGATIKDGASPYNKSIDLTARGWHGPRGARPAPVPFSPSASQAGFRPCSQLIDALYARCKSCIGNVPYLLALAA